MVAIELQSNTFGGHGRRLETVRCLLAILCREG